MMYMIMTVGIDKVVIEMIEKLDGSCASKLIKMCVNPTSSRGKC